MAAKRQAAGLVLDAPYTSMLDLARLHYPYLPAKWFLRDRYETIRHVTQVKVPLLIVHGANDAVIPVAMGQSVLDAALAEKEMLKVDGAGHLDHDGFGSFDRIIAWMERVVAGDLQQRAGKAR